MEKGSRKALKGGFYRSKASFDICRKAPSEAAFAFPSRGKYGRMKPVQ
jgi:hypothetical protein